MINILVGGEIPNSLCLPFYDLPTPSFLVKLVTFLVTSVQIVFCAGIAFLHGKLVTHLNKKQSNIMLTKSRVTSNRALKIQLIIVSVSCFVCWIPSDIVFVCSHFVSEYSIDFLIWVAIIATPTNSIMSPCVFIVTHIRKKSQEKQKKSAAEKTV